MTQNGWNPWKMTAIGMAVVVVTALVTGLVVANWTGTERDRAAADTPAVASAKAGRVASAAAAAPSKSAIEACNRYAASKSGGKKDAQGKTVEVVKDGAIGAALGAAVGAAGGAIADGGKGAGKGAAIGGLVGAGAGTLYGLDENRKSDERYRAAYSSCMRSRGYAS